MINMDMHLNRGMILKKMRLQGFILDVILFKYRAIRGSGTLFFFLYLMNKKRQLFKFRPYYRHYYVIS